MQADDLWGFVDKYGATVIAPRFQNAQDFSQGFACVQIEGKWGYIDPAGQVVIKPQFDFAYPFSNGLARVDLGDCNRNEFSFSERRTEDCRFGYIDRTGKYVWKPRH